MMGEQVVTVSAVRFVTGRHHRYTLGAVVAVGAVVVQGVREKDSACDLECSCDPHGRIR